MGILLLYYRVIIFIICLVKQVFSSLEVLGWYTNGTLPVEDDTKFHEQVQHSYYAKFISELFD